MEGELRERAFDKLSYWENDISRTASTYGLFLFQDSLSYQGDPLVGLLVPNFTVLNHPSGLECAAQPEMKTT